MRVDSANKCNHLVSANVISLDPILNVLANVTVVHDDDDVTVVTSNRSPHQTTTTTEARRRPLMAATARTIFGTPMPQYLNALSIAANKAIADTGATAIFIMDNAEVDKTHCNQTTHNKFARRNHNMVDTRLQHPNTWTTPNINRAHRTIIKNSLPNWDSTFMQGRMQSRF